MCVCQCVCMRVCVCLSELDIVHMCVCLSELDIVHVCVCVCVRHAVGCLYGAGQVGPLPHVDVAVERPGVGDLFFGRGHTQDGLQVARLPKYPPLGGQRVPTQRPELSWARGEERERERERERGANIEREREEVDIEREREKERGRECVCTSVVELKSAAQW